MVYDVLLGAISFPGGGVTGPKGYVAVGVLEGNIISSLVVAVDFEQVCDPVVIISFFQVHQQLDRQLGRQDITDDCEQFPVTGVEGEQDHVVQLKGHFGVGLFDFYPH